MICQQALGQLFCGITLPIKHTRLVVLAVVALCAAQLSAVSHTEVTTAPRLPFMCGMGIECGFDGTRLGNQMTYLNSQSMYDGLVAKGFDFMRLPISFCDYTSYDSSTGVATLLEPQPSAAGGARPRALASRNSTRSSTWRQKSMPEATVRSLRRRRLRRMPSRPRCSTASRLTSRDADYHFTVAHSAWLVWTPDGLPFAFGTESGAGFAADADALFVA